VLQVPTFHGMTLSLCARLKRPVDGDGVRAVLEGADGLKLLDAPPEKIYPMPMLAVPDPAVLVGRVRASGDRVQLVACVDGAGRVAAAAAQMAALLLERE
jgi:aspartate-semialdehyde dehydrogenase